MSSATDNAEMISEKRIWLSVISRRVIGELSAPIEPIEKPWQGAHTAGSWQMSLDIARSPRRAG
jgi:hypothetical protein